jgi:hypothetical protein
MSELFQSHQLESIDNSLARTLIRRVGERIIGRILVKALLENDL